MDSYGVLFCLTKTFSVFFLITSVAFAEVVVRPLGQAKIATGDIVEVFIEADTIPDLSGETIGNILYVLEQREQNLSKLAIRRSSWGDDCSSTVLSYRPWIRKLLYQLRL